MSIHASLGSFALQGLFELRAVTDGVVVDQGNGTNGSFKLEVDSGDLVLSTTDNSGTSRVNTIDTGVSIGNIYVFSINARAQGYEARLNGSDVASQSNDITGARAGKKFNIGDPNATSSALARHCEWVFGTEHLTSADILNFEGYLGHQWGSSLELPTTHIYRTIQPTITGGSRGQILAKLGDGDYDVGWVDPTPYNVFKNVGNVSKVDVETKQHGQTLLVGKGDEVVDVILPYNPATGWQVFVINRNGNYPIRFLAKDSGGHTNSIVPDAGWGKNGDPSTTCYLKSQGDSASATWDRVSQKWYMQGALQTQSQAFDFGVIASNQSGVGIDY